MKKIWISTVSIMLSCCLCLGIAGCSGGDKEDKATIGVTVDGNAQANGGTFEAVVGREYAIAANASNDAQVSVSYVFEQKSQTLTGERFTPTEEGDYLFTFTAEGADAFKLTLSAEEEAPPVVQYTLSFALGAHAAADAEEISDRVLKAGEKMELPAAPKAADGYTFKGWTDGTATYAAGAEYTVKADATLTAVWAAEEYTITFALGDHAAADATAPAAIKVSHGKRAQLPAPVKGAEGYVFEGWSDGERVYDAGAEYAPSGDVLLTAQWRAQQAAEKLVVTFSLGEHAAADVVVPTSQEAEAGTEITLPEAIEGAEGYTFVGWSDGSKTYAASSKYTVVARVTLTAVYEAELYSVGYAAGEHAAQGAALPQAKEYEMNTPITLAAAIEGAEGYTFAGWSDGKKTYTAGDSYTVTGDVTFTAQWKEAAKPQPALVNADLESGDLNGWTVTTLIANEDGVASVSISDEKTYWADQQPFFDQNGETVQMRLMQGNYYLRTDERATSVTKSASFTLGGDGLITFLFGAAKNPVSYVALCDAQTNDELVKVVNDSFKDPTLAETMLRRVMYATDYIGREVYIKIVDGATSDFGFVNFDDLRVSMTKEEAQALIAQDKAWAESYRQDVLDSTAQMGVNAKNVINDIRGYYAALSVKDIDGVYFTATIADKAVTAGSVDITAYLEEADASMLGVQHGTLEKSVVKVNDGEKDYTSGFDAFAVAAGKTYTVTYRITDPASKRYAEDTFVLTATSSNEIVNGGFETGDLTGWTWQEGTGDGQISGTGAVLSDSTWWAEQLPYNQGGNYHFDGWKANATESNTYALKSSTFTLGGSGYISFKMGGNAAVVKVYKANGEQIAEYKNTAFKDAGFPNLDEGCRLATMTTFVADLSQYKGEQLYIELCDVAADGWAVAFFDDIVTYYEQAPQIDGKYDTVQFYKKTGDVLATTPTDYNIAWVKAVNVL